MRQSTETAGKVPEWLWKLPAITAMLLSFGVVGAASISIFLRPAPDYILPLLVDVASHRPESNLLQVTLATSVLFLCITVVSCSFHADFLDAVSNRRKKLIAVFVLIVSFPLLSRTIRLLIIDRPMYSASFFVWTLSFGWLLRFRQGLKSQIAAISDSANQLNTVKSAQISSNRWFCGCTRRLTRWVTDFCVSGNIVCAFKIIGLWIALDNFSIARRHYIRLGILCTLAFVEYTAVILFCIFLMVIASELRSFSSMTDLNVMETVPLTKKINEKIFE